MNETSGIDMNTHSGVTILIADDNVELQEMLSMALSNVGYHVLLVNDGEQAIVRLREALVDLILLDLKMPKVDGWGVLAFVKRQLPAVHVVVLTGYGSLTNALRAKKMGADDFLDKPYEVEEILLTIERIMHQDPTSANA